MASLLHSTRAESSVSLPSAGAGRALVCCLPLRRLLRGGTQAPLPLRHPNGTAASPSSSAAQAAPITASASTSTVPPRGVNLSLRPPPAHPRTMPCDGDRSIAPIVPPPPIASKVPPCGTSTLQPYPYRPGPVLPHRPGGSKVRRCLGKPAACSLAETYAAVRMRSSSGRRYCCSRATALSTCSGLHFLHGEPSVASCSFGSAALLRELRSRDASSVLSAQCDNRTRDIQLQHCAWSLGCSGITAARPSTNRKSPCDCSVNRRSHSRL